MRRCANPENQAHVAELERLIKKQTREMKDYREEVRRYEIYIEYLENLLEKAGIPYNFNQQTLITGDK